ncbi:MAG: GNAT family N-acetyltransferase [Dehalococcoidia bacterium]
MGGAPFVLREGSPADFPALARIDGSFANDYVLELDRRGGGAEQTVELRWRRMKAAGSTRRETAAAPGEQVEELASEWLRSDRLIVAEIDGAAAAYLMLGTNWNRTAELTLIIVDAAHRRRGLGARLVQEAETYARERGLRALQWEAQNDNRNAIEFALARGFRIAGFHDALYRNDDLARQSTPDFRGMALFLTKALG